MERLKVLLHVNEASRWPVLLINAGNLVNDVGPEKVAIEVVANGEAVTVFANGFGQGSALREMERLAGVGVDFVLCRNALAMHSVPGHRLPSFVRIVPAGITEIIRKQLQGYAYVKP
ncbi:MAG: DsrE family protein [Bacillota bacterium]